MSIAKPKKVLPTWDDASVLTAQCTWCYEYRTVDAALEDGGAHVRVWCRVCRRKKYHQVWSYEDCRRAFDYLLGLHKQFGVVVRRSRPDSADRGTAQVELTEDGPVRAVWINPNITLYWAGRVLSDAWQWFSATAVNRRNHFNGHRWYLERADLYTPSGDGRPWQGIAWGIPKGSR